MARRVETPALVVGYLGVLAVVVWLSLKALGSESYLPWSC